MEVSVPKWGTAIRQSNPGMDTEVCAYSRPSQRALRAPTSAAASLGCLFAFFRGLAAVLGARGGFSASGGGSTRAPAPSYLAASSPAQLAAFSALSSAADMKRPHGLPAPPLDEGGRDLQRDLDALSANQAWASL